MSSAAPTGYAMQPPTHTHLPAEHDLGDGLKRFVLSVWDLDAAPPRGDVIRLSAAGLQRLPL